MGLLLGTIFICPYFSFFQIPQVKSTKLADNAHGFQIAPILG